MSEALMSLRLRLERISGLFWGFLMYNPVGKCDVYDNRLAVNEAGGMGSATEGGRPGVEWK